MAFRELKGSGGGAFFKWERIGTEFTGRFEKLGEGVYQGKATYHAVFIDREGKTIKVNTPTILRDKLSEALPGEYVEIRYTGDLPKQGAKTGAKEFYVRVVPPPGASQAAEAPPQNAPAVKASADVTPPASIAEMRAKLEARIGPDATQAMVAGITAKYAPDVEAITKALGELLAAHGIK